MYLVLSEGVNEKERRKFAFRQWYGHLSEIRAIAAPSVPVLCLTATATKATVTKIINTCRLKNCKVIKKNPDRPEIKYMAKEVNDDPSSTFRWLIKELEERGIETPKTIIYCRTIKDCGLVYEAFRTSLPGSKSYQTSSCPKTPVYRLYGMYHNATEKENKEIIASAFSKGFILAEL